MRRSRKRALTDVGAIVEGRDGTLEMFRAWLMYERATRERQEYEKAS